MNTSLRRRFGPWRLIVAIVALSVNCLAGGSIGWEEVAAQISKEDTFMAAFIAQHFDVAPSGGAVRVGRDREGNSTVPGVEIGTRLPPYDFKARSKGSSGDYTLHLTFEPISADDGKTITWQVAVRKNWPSSKTRTE